MLFLSLLHSRCNVFHPAGYQSPNFLPSAWLQVFVSSKDGTQVPMFVVHKRGLQLDGTNPTLLYGYGGFNSEPF